MPYLPQNSIPGSSYVPPTGEPVPEPVIVEQGSSAPAVTGPPPTQAAPVASESYGGPVPEPAGPAYGNPDLVITTYPSSGAPVADIRSVSTGATGQADLAQRDTSMSYQPARPMAASASYGGPDPNAPTINTGVVWTSYPSTGRPPSADIVPSARAKQEYGRDQRLAEMGAEWRAHPVERRPPPPGYSPNNTGSVPGGPGNLWRRTPAELSAFRSTYRLNDPSPGADTPPLVDSRGTPYRPPTPRIIHPIPLPVTNDVSWRQFMNAFLQEHGIWPFYRFGFQNDLGAPLNDIGLPPSPPQRG